MISLGGYAIVDVTKGGTSEGKVLVVLDEADEAREIADELRRRGCAVVVKVSRRERDPIRTTRRADTVDLAPPVFATD